MLHSVNHSQDSRSLHASVANDGTITNHSTYQQMKVGGDTHSASEAGHSPEERYQPLASNSSQHQLSGRESASHPNHSCSQFGPFQSHVGNFEKLAQEQQSTSREAGPDVAEAGNTLRGVVDTKDAVSEPSMISKRTEMHSEKQDAKGRSAEDNVNFQQFQMYQPDHVLLAKSTRESPKDSNFQPINFINIGRSTQEHSLHGAESQPPREIHSNTKAQDRSLYGAQSNRFEPTDRQPERQDLGLLRKEDKLRQIQGNEGPLSQSVLNEHDRKRLVSGPLNDQSMVSAFGKAQPYPNIRTREYVGDQQLCLRSMHAAHYCQKENLNLSNQELQMKFLHHDSTRPKEHEIGNKPAQIGSRAENQEAYLNIYDERELTKSYPYYQKAEFGAQRSEDQSTNSEGAEDYSGNALAVAPEKKVVTRNGPGMTQQTTSQNYGRTTDTGPGALSGDRQLDNHVKSFRQMVTGESKNALQLINDHSSKNFDDFQRTHENSVQPDEVGSHQVSQREATREPLQNSLSKQFKLFGWGLNDLHQLGQLGMHTMDSIQTSPRSNAPSGAAVQNILFPRELRDLDFQVKQIACGLSHSLILTTTGEVLALGENSHGQLGLPVSSNPILSFPTRSILKLPDEMLHGLVSYDISQVSTSPGHDSHSLLLVCGANRQILLGSGLNSHGQLGASFLMPMKQTILDKFVELDTVSSQLRSNMSIFKIACGARFSVIAVASLSGTQQQQRKHEELWVLGDTRAHSSTSDEILRTTLPESGLKDLRCSDDQIVALMNDGKVLGQDRAGGFSMRVINFFSNRVVEIASAAQVYAALDYKNKIYRWKADQTMITDGNANTETIELPSQYSTQMFLRLSVGSEFLHVVDEQGNLYGWGNNKHGELGTGDCFPRPVLSQIRVFNMQKMYLRCKNVFSGHSFAFGLFDANEDKNEEHDLSRQMLKSSKSVDRNVCDNSIVTSLTRQLRVSHDVIHKSQAFSKSAIVSGGARRVLDPANNARGQHPSPRKNLEQYGNEERASVGYRNQECGISNQRDLDFEGEQRLFENGARNPGSLEGRQVSNLPTQKDPITQSVYKPPLTPLSAATAAGARRLLDFEPRNQKTPDRAQAWALTPEQPSHPTQPHVVGLGHQGKNLPLDAQTPNLSQPLQNTVPKRRLAEGARGGSQAQVNREFVDQLNKTEEALQKYRRAASNYRENAYRIKVMDQVDGRGNGMSRGCARPEVARTVGRYAYVSKSLPRYMPGGSGGFGPSPHEHSLDLVNCSTSSAQDRRLVDAAANTGPVSNASKTLATLERDNQYSQPHKYSPDLNVSVRAPIAAPSWGIAKPGDRFGVDPRSLPETSYGSKEPRAPAAAEICHDGAADEVSMQAMEPLGAGLVQAESNMASQEAITHSSQKYSCLQRNHEMMQYGVGNGLGGDQDSKWSQPKEARDDGDSLDREEQPAKEEAAHRRHRSSISMAGPHICPQLEASGKDLDSSHACNKEKTAAHDSFDVRDALAMVRDSSQGQSMRLASEPSMNALTQSYAVGLDANQSSQNALAQSYQQNAQLDSSMSKWHPGYALSKSFAEGQQQQQPPIVAPPSSQSYNIRETYGRPLRSKKLTPQAQIVSPATNPERSFREELPLQMNGYVPPMLPAVGPSSQLRRSQPGQAQDPTSPDANLGLARMPSQIMANRGLAEADRSEAASALETIIKEQQQSLNQSNQENQSENRRPQFKILTKEEWRQEMMRDRQDSGAPWYDRGGEAGNRGADRRGRSHDAVQRWQKPSDPARNIMRGETEANRQRFGDLYGPSAILPHKDSRVRSSDERDTNQNTYGSIVARKLDSRSFDPPHQPRLSSESKRRRRQEALKNLKERAYMLGNKDAVLFGQQAQLRETRGRQDQAHGTIDEEDMKNIRGLDTFSHEHLNPCLNNQMIFGGQATTFNIIRSNAANSQSNMGSVMSTASLGPRSKESNMQRSGSGGHIGLGASLQRALNPPTVTSIEIMENNTRDSVVVQDQLVEKGKLDSKMSSMQNIREASLCGMMSRELDSHPNSQETRRLRQRSPQKDIKRKEDHFGEVKVDLEAYKVAPYSGEQLVDSNEHAKPTKENVVLDYSAATSQGVEFKKRVKHASRVLGQRVANSSGGQESRTTLTMLSSITQSKGELQDYQGQNSQRRTSDHHKLNLDGQQHVRHGSEHNTNHLYHVEDGNNTHGTSSVQGISISHSTIDHIGVGGGETVGQRLPRAPQPGAPDTYRLDTTVVQLSQAANDSQGRSKASTYKPESNKTFHEMQAKLTSTKQKLNKYKRKLKKYIANNAELQRDLELKTEQNSRLKTQNDTLLKCDEQKEGVSQVLQDQLSTMEKQMMSMRQSYEEQIKQLSEENFQMLTELQERDEKQRILQEKLEYVENEIESIGMQLKEQSDINALLREQMALQAEEQQRRSARQTSSRLENEQIVERQNAEIEQLRAENQRLKEEQCQMRMDNQQLQIKMLNLEKNNMQLEQNSRVQEPNQAVAFKSHEYLHAIGKLNDMGEQMAERVVQYSNRGIDNCSGSQIEDLQEQRQRKDRARPQETLTALTSPGGIEDLNEIVHLHNGASSRHQAPLDYVEEGQAQNAKTARSKGSRTCDKKHAQTSVSFQPSHGEHEDLGNNFEELRSDMVRHKQLSNNQERNGRADSMSGHLHTSSQITQQTSKTHNSQVTAQTRDVQYHFRTDMVAPCLEKMNIHSNSNTDEPDIIDHSQLQSQISSLRAFQAHDGRQTSGLIPKQVLGGDPKDVRPCVTGSRESRMELVESRKGEQGITNMHLIDFDQVDQSSIAVVDQSTNRIEHQLNEDLFMNESQNQVVGQQQLNSGRSKSVPPNLINATPGSAGNKAGTSSFNGARPHEVSMAQLNHAQDEGGSGFQGQSSKEPTTILFNAYPREGYPNYSYVQRRYLQNPPVIAHTQIESINGGRSSATAPTMPPQLKSSPLNHNMEGLQHVLMLNNDSASESEVDLHRRAQPAKSACILVQNEPKPALSRLPQLQNGANTSAGRNAKNERNEEETSRTQQAARAGSRIGKGLEQSYQEKFKQLSLQQQEQLIKFINCENANSQHEVASLAESVPSTSTLPQRTMTFSKPTESVAKAAPRDKYNKIVEKIERIESQNRTLTIHADRNRSSENHHEKDDNRSMMTSLPGRHQHGRDAFSPTSHAALASAADVQQQPRYGIDTTNFIGKNGKTVQHSIAYSSSHGERVGRTNNGSQAKRPQSHITDDSLEPARESHDTKRSQRREGSASAPEQEERIVDYRDAILNKFAKRTTDRIEQEMKEKDRGSSLHSGHNDQEEQEEGQPRRGHNSNSLQKACQDHRPGQRQQSHTVESKCSRSVDNMNTIEYRAPQRIGTALEGKSRSIQLERGQQPAGADAQPGSMSGRPLKGPQLRSVDRLNQIHEDRKAKDEEVKMYRNRSRDWVQRKDRERTAENADVVHKDIAQKYKDAFKNLSQELKKKMNDVGHSRRHETDEDCPEGPNPQGAKSHDSLENPQARRPERQLSWKYLEASTAGPEKQLFHSNVSNESFGPAKSANSGAGQRTSQKQLGSLMKALQLDDGKPARRTASPTEI